MYAYIAFKQLGGVFPSALHSEFPHAHWQMRETPFRAVLPVLQVSEEDWENGLGIDASTPPDQLARDGEQPYIVVPWPGCRLSVQARSWHADVVICLSPFCPSDRASIAKLVLRSALSGLPQLKAVQRWAVFILLRELLAGQDDDCISILSVFLRRLDMHEMRTIAGPLHPKLATLFGCSYDRIDIDLLMPEQDGEGANEFRLKTLLRLAQQGHLTPSWESGFAVMLNPMYLYLAGKSSVTEEGLTKIRAALCAWRDARWLYQAGCDWPAQNYSPEIRSALIESADPTAMFLAGRDWPEGRYEQDIVDGLVAFSDPEALYLAGASWSDARYDKRICEALAKTGSAKYLYMAGRDWVGKRFCPEIAQALVKTANSQYLLLAGQDWPDDHFDPKIQDALIATHDPAALFLAGLGWSAKRYHPALLGALRETQDSYWIKRAEMEWPPERLTA